MRKQAPQTKNGKAFEFALLNEFYQRLNIATSVHIIENEPYKIAKRCFESFDEIEQGVYKLISSFAINFLIDIEPRLSNSIAINDFLQLEIISDKQGQLGDVRDVLAIRSSQNWEIGVSAKNNHRAAKHSRLSNKIDFGKKWLGYNCSQEYFNEIKPYFDELAYLRTQSKSTKTWESLDDYQTNFYVPILNAFKNELLRLESKNPEIAQRLVEYLIGKHDFYKVIKGSNSLEIQAYNLQGNLSLPFENIKPKFKMPKLKLPNRLIEVIFQDNSKTTLLITLNEGWQISFRIHNASSRVESSLKFDINLVSAPASLFTNHLSIEIGKVL